MKKILFTLLFISTLFIGYTDVTIGNGTETGKSLPIEPFYGYSYSQVIYLQSEIAAAGDITELSWHFAGSSLSNSNDWTIYIGHTTKSEFSSTSDWIDVSTLTQVWSGTFTDPGTSGWITFDITDFTYNNTDNLVIAVDENASSYNGSSDDFYCTTVSGDRGIEYHNDSTNPDPASPPTASYGNPKAYIANVILGGITQACPSPTSPFTDNITATGASLNWTAGGSEPNWNIEWGLTGFSQGTGTLIQNTTQNPYSLSGLSAGTSYDWYVQADCDGGTRDESAWVGPYTFTTLCAAEPLPISEDFDGVTTPDLPNCWSMIDDTGNSYSTVATTTSYPHSSPNCARIYNSSATTGNLILISPESSHSADGTRVKFWARTSSGDQNLLVGTMSDPTDPATFTTIQTISINETYTEYTVYLSGTDNYVAFKHAMDGTYDTNYIDDFTWEEIPSCLEPTSLYTDNITATGASLNWTAGGTEPNWNIEWGLTGFSQGTGTLIQNTTQNPYSLSGLSAGTSYDWYVQADCDGGTRDESAWVGPYTFVTLVANDICADAEAISEVNDYAFNTSSATTSGFDSHSINQDIWYVYTPSANGLVTIDLCGSTFDTKLAVYGECDVNTELGYSDDNSTVCTSRSMQSAIENIAVVSGEDYMIQVGGYGSNSGAGDITITLDSCVPADSTETNNIAQTTADLNWYNFGEPTTWDVIIDTAGFAFDVNDTPTYSGVTAPYGVSGLTPNTDYEWYVMPTCGDTLDWVGPVAFTTLASCPFPSDLNATNIGPDQADLSWTENGSASSWQIEIDTTGFTPTGTATHNAGTNPYTITGLSNETTYDYYVRAVCTLDYSDWVGPYTFTTLVSCPVPTDPVTTNIGASSADLGWTAGWTETYWNIEWGITGFAQGTGTLVNTNSNPYPLTGLTENTTYDWYVQADCSTSRDSSVWVGPISFTTPCNVFTPEYTEDFTTFLPDCWAEGKGPVTGPTSYGSSYWTADGWLNSGTTGAAKINLYYNTRQEWLISPEIDISAGGYEVTFDVAVTVWGGTDPSAMGSDDQVQLLITTNGGTSWSNLETWNAANTPSNTGDYEVIDISAYTGTAQFAYWAVDGPVDDAEDYDFFVDNFRVRTVPACPEPYNLYTDNITDTGADFNWTAGGTEPNWNVEYGPVGFIQGTGTLVPNTTNPYTATGLNSATMYDWYVQADCDGGARDESGWVGPQTFTTTGSGDCEHYIVLTDDYGDGWNGGLVDIYRNGILDIDNLTLASGTGPDTTFISANSGDSLFFDYTAGSWATENEYVVYRESDDLEIVHQGAGGAEPGDASIDYCCPPPTLAVTPDSYDFGTIPYNKAPTKIFTLTNIGMGIVTVANYSDITLTGDPEFTIVNTSFSNGEPGLLPSDILTVEVQFAPGSDISYSTVLSVVWTGSVRSQTDVNITGTGCTPVANDDCVNAESISAPYPQSGSGSNECAYVDCPGYLDWNTIWYEIELPYSSNDVNITICGDGVDLYSVGVVLMDDCACDDYLLYSSIAWGDSCGTGWEGAKISYDAVPGPTTMLWPAYAVDANYNGIPFIWTVDVNAVDFQPVAPDSVAISVDQSTNMVTVSWDYNASYKYNVYSDTDPYGTFATVEGSDITADHLDITPIPGVNTFYRVTADVFTRSQMLLQTDTSRRIITATAPKNPKIGKTILINTKRINTTEK